MEKKSLNLTTPILILLLVVASFLVGSMWSQIKEMKGLGGKGTGKDDQPVAQTSPVPEAPVVLGEADLSKLKDGGVAAKGKPEAKVTIVEFSEFECPFCKRYVDETYPQILKEYGDKIYYVFHDYPLPFHTHAQKTAEAGRCAAGQGKFWEMHDMLFAERDTWAPLSDITATLGGYASKIGLNVSNFNSCLSSGKYTQAVKDDIALGQKLGVTGTPSFFINGQLIVGAMPFANFKTVIDAELAK